MKNIEDMINRPYGANLQGQSRRYVCWHFCREIYAMLGMELKYFNLQKELTRTAGPVVPCIVLFHAVVKWHSGMVWPDGLHFIHAGARNIFDPDPAEYIVLKDRLTAWPYNRIIEGYYVP